MGYNSGFKGLNCLFYDYLLLSARIFDKRFQNVTTEGGLRGFSSALHEYNICVSVTTLTLNSPHLFVCFGAAVLSGPEPPHSGGF